MVGFCSMGHTFKFKLFAPDHYHCDTILDLMQEFLIKSKLKSLWPLSAPWWKDVKCNQEMAMMEGQGQKVNNDNSGKFGTKF